VFKPTLDGIADRLQLERHPAFDLYGSRIEPEKGEHCWQSTVPRGGIWLRWTRRAGNLPEMRPSEACQGPVLDKQGGLGLDFRLRQGKKVCCHVV
jgi:hypothetical protein